MPRVIKRYDNRKLYDTEAKSYVSLEELATLIRNGEEISVLENATGEDITVQTLAKIISEMDTQKASGSPTAVLHDVVRWGEQVFESGRQWKDQQFDRMVAASLERSRALLAVRSSLEALEARIAKLEDPRTAGTAAEEENVDSGEPQPTSE